MQRISGRGVYALYKSTFYITVHYITLLITHFTTLVDPEVILLLGPV